VVLLYVLLSANITNPIYIEQLRETVPPSSHNTVAVCNEITILILYYISSKIIAIFHLTVSFKLINFSFQIFLLFVPAMSASFTYYIALVWIL